MKINKFIFPIVITSFNRNKKHCQTFQDSFRNETKEFSISTHGFVLYFNYHTHTHIYYFNDIRIISNLES